MKGTRLPDAVMGEDGPGWDAWAQGKCAPGSYMKVNSGEYVSWYIRDPYGQVGSLVTHKVEEHEDGSITVTPSILDPANYSAEEIRELGIPAIVPHGPMGTPGWHGWLTRGEWIEA